MPNNDFVLKVNGISRRFGQIKALDNVSFNVKAQSIFGLLGPNGAGKTTLFSIVANFIHPDSGSIEVLGHNVKEVSKIKGRLTILPQDALFQQNVPIIEQLIFFRLLDGKTKAEAEKEVKRTLEMVGLGEYINRRIHSLSHGMIKRLGIAQAFLGDPEVILLDEATSGLDPKNAKQIRDLIRELQTRSTIVISSHNLAEIQDLCDHVAILHQGKLVACGSVAEITRTGRKMEVSLSRLLTSEETEKLSSLPGIKSLSLIGSERYSIALDLARMEASRPGEDPADKATSNLVQAILDFGITPREFRVGATLEEHFLKVTGKEAES
jgi:ABC-2 type transport system ATP-binding protein